MSLFHDSALVGSSGQSTGYQISRSLRFNSSDSAYLSRTPASAGNRKTWTWAGWVKRSKLAVSDFELFSAGSADQIRFSDDNGGNSLRIITASGSVITSQLFRDTSSWYHIVVALDTSQATSSDRIKLYINGAQVTAFFSATYPALNADTGFNSATAHNLGAMNGNYGFFDGYLADIHFIDGQALTPSSFAETNATTGQWVPKAYTGSYGTNGFRLAFADNSNNTATTLGKDTSGNGNNWTPNNLSVTAGAGNDSLVDTPTSYGTDTGAGGEVRGNYATLNPLQTKEVAVLSNGNLNYAAGSSVDTTAAATIIPTAGKWYWETTITSAYTSAYWGGTGVSLVNAPLAKVSESSTAGVWASTDSSLGGLWINGSRQSTHTTWSNNDVIGCAFDAGAMTLEVYRNNVKLGSTISVPSGYYRPFVFVARDTGSSVTNFGQRPFAYTAPSGFKALCDTNLPAPVVAKPSTVMDVKLYTGNSSTQTISGLGFSPDFTWIKCRNSSVPSHCLFDTIRGATKGLHSNETVAEWTAASTLTSFNSDGFSLGSDGFVNDSTRTYVAWAWDAGSSTVTNTQGSITSQVRTNASAGFSIVTYTGNGTNGATVGHGLNVHADLIIVKNRSAASDWTVSLFTSRETGMAWSHVMFLNKTDSQTDSPAGGKIRSGSANTTTFECVTGSSNAVNVNTLNNNYVAYCFSAVAGYSSMGSFVGNGSNDGPMLWLGFRPKWFMYKVVTQAQPWVILDGNRSQSNIVGDYLLANSSDAEGNFGIIDFLSNGVKVRYSGGSLNVSGQTYIYAAFAENPFQYARAR